VAEGLGTDPELGFAAACREATGGTPFLVRMLVEALQEEGISPVAASAAKAPGVATATLGRWAGLRLARLGPDAVRLAGSVAILERAELAQAAQLAGLTAAAAARTSELLVRAGVLTERPLAFAHPLLRSAVYREMAVADRAGKPDEHADYWPGGRFRDSQCERLGASVLRRSRRPVLPMRADAGRAHTATRDRLPGRKAQIQPAEGAAHLLEARTAGQVSEVDDGEVVRFEY
jgi:hypothetical protein